MIALTILVIVDARDVGTALSGALSRATEQALGARAMVSISAVDSPTTEPSIVERARAANASVAVRISFDDPARLQARVHVVEVQTGRAEIRTVVFEPTDPLSERGRTLGLLVASIIDPSASGRTERGPPPPPNPSLPTPLPPTAVAAVPPAALPSPDLWAVDVAAGGGLALGGAGSGVGGTVGVRRSLGGRFALRIGLGGRIGEIPAAQASASTFALSAGGVVTLAAPSERRRLGLAVRADALLLLESATHLSADDPSPVRQGRFIPGASLLIEGQLALSAAVRLVLSAGPEIAFGRTDVFVGQERVAELVPCRLLAQVGLLARF